MNKQELDIDNVGTPAETAPAGTLIPAPSPSTDGALCLGRSTYGGVDELAGVEVPSGSQKVRTMLPYLCVLGFVIHSPAVIAIGLTMVVGSWAAGKVMGRNRSTALTESNDRMLLKPSAAVKKGFGVWACTFASAIAAGHLGLFHYVYGPSLYRAIWTFFTWRAVRSASRTDAQTGWMTGATSLTAFSLIWWSGWATRLGWVFTPLPWMVLALSVGSIHQTYRYLSTSGSRRSLAALKAVLMSAAAALLFSPLGAPSFLPCVVTTIAVSLILPIWMSRQRLQLGPAADKPALPVLD